MKFDLITNMYAEVKADITGTCADVLTVLALTHIEHRQDLLALIGGEAAPDHSELVDLFRRSVQRGVFGRDERGGYISHIHAAHA
ncbi:hypothetical protein OG936_36720 [Streptomyces sp. NBC_00846]|uniref:hypothetical protein n=1 Tax=Streptomyces sp. NBC_00846 TaxID=2975849 RepID=UPI0038659397|nr:hypothetical protein OG936_36720 [Streptomyces sp. NBC_00846]